MKALNSQSAIIPAGDVKIGDLDYYVYSNSLIDVVDKINDIPIKIVNGTPVLIRDIGTAADSAAVQTSIVRVNGREATYIPITRQEGANTLEVTDGIRAKLTKLTEIPSGTTVKFLYDQSLYIRQAIANLQKEGLLGAGLAGLMIFHLPGERESGAGGRPRHSPLAHRGARRALSDRPKREHHDSGRIGARDRDLARQQYRGAGKPPSPFGDGQRWALGGGGQRDGTHAADSRRDHLHPDRVPAHHVFYRHRQVPLRAAGHDGRLRHAGGLCRLHVGHARHAGLALSSRPRQKSGRRVVG